MWIIKYIIDYTIKYTIEYIIKYTIKYTIKQMKQLWVTFFILYSCFIIVILS